MHAYKQQQEAGRHCNELPYFYYNCGWAKWMVGSTCLTLCTASALSAHYVPVPLNAQFTNRIPTVTHHKLESLPDTRCTNMEHSTLIAHNAGKTKSEQVQFRLEMYNWKKTSTLSPVSFPNHLHRNQFHEFVVNSIESCTQHTAFTVR